MWKWNDKRLLFDCYLFLLFVACKRFCILIRSALPSIYLIAVYLFLCLPISFGVFTFIAGTLAGTLAGTFFCYFWLPRLVAVFVAISFCKLKFELRPCCAQFKQILKHCNGFLFLDQSAVN